MRVIILSGSKNISKVDFLKVPKMCRNLLASKIKDSWLTKASHVCTVKPPPPPPKQQQKNLGSKNSNKSKSRN